MADHGAGWDGVYGGTPEGLDIIQTVAFNLPDGVVLDRGFWDMLKAAVDRLEKSV